MKKIATRVLDWLWDRAMDLVLVHDKPLPGDAKHR